MFIFFQDSKKTGYFSLLNIYKTPLEYKSDTPPFARKIGYKHIGCDPYDDIQQKQHIDIKKWVPKDIKQRERDRV
ncbi:hypothetical protein SJDPG2_01570 [Porphyromonas gingivalis SJD2]|nr:hypothetical protein SJDPG2_01570 [Porphyromonas gingivalis SJD2]